MAKILARNEYSVFLTVLPWLRIATGRDRKSTRLNSSHTEIYTLSLHDALPILLGAERQITAHGKDIGEERILGVLDGVAVVEDRDRQRSEEHTSELQSHRDLHSFPTRRSSDLAGG